MIYCVEDDEAIRNMMIYTLNASGFSAEGCGCAKELYAALGRSIPQLIMLDIMLPNESGTDILIKLKNDLKTREIPVIMASAKGSEFDKVSVLDCGADDYLVKPFGMMEMVSRVKAVLRRSGVKSENILKAGELSMNTAEHTLKAGNENISLTLKEYELLRVLMENSGMVFSREKLLEKIWGYDFDGENRTVDVHIRTLRSKLGKYAKYIVTVHGVGYKVVNQA